MSMPGYTPKPHQRHAMRFVPDEKKKRIQYGVDKRREEQGKTVVRLHESFTDGKFPLAEYIKADVLAFHAEHGRLPTQIRVHFSTTTKKYCLSVPELGLPWPIITLQVVPGEFMELA